MPPTESANPPSTPAIRAVVIDDDRVARSLVERLLTNKGVEVVSLERSFGAYEVVASQVPHLLIVDVVMPGLDVEAFVARVKSTPALHGVIILLLSGMTVQTLEALVRRTGAHGFLSKTRGAIHLNEVVSSWIKQLRG